MRRFVIMAVAAGFLLPAAADAQLPRLLAGGGLSNPIGDFSDDIPIDSQGQLVTDACGCQGEGVCIAGDMA